MKKSFILSLLLTLAGKIFAYVDTATPNTPIKTDYLKKQNSKSIAWVLPAETDP